MENKPPVKCHSCFSNFLFFGVTAFFAFLLILVALGPINGRPSPEKARQWALMQKARIIGLLMFEYANDNNGKYPDGASSTEVFQKLLDGKYVEDPSLFYIPLPGKTASTLGQKLKPENVCWDVTCCLDANSSAEVPIVFMTGYKVTYAPGGTAVPLIKPFPPFDVKPRTWSGWWQGESEHTPLFGAVVAYKNNSAVFRRSNYPPLPDGTIPNFISPDFKPNGKIYLQLTPDGPLP